jgi:hypothetical protein
MHRVPAPGRSGLSVVADDATHPHLVVSLVDRDLADVEIGAAEDDPQFELADACQQLGGVLRSRKPRISHGCWGLPSGQGGSGAPWSGTSLLLVMVSDCRG